MLTLCTLALLCNAIPAQAAPLSSSDVEAAYLYNFGKFIEWPASPDPANAPFSICVVGKDDFAATLDSLVHNDTINGRAIVARQLASIEDANGCQILFLGTSEQPRLARDLDAIKERSILTVSTIPGFVDRGGMIQFLIRDSRVRFSVNLASATRAHLALSSELLKVAVSVNSKPSREGQ
ncbi:MAG TPA: YfiR family protein [Acidobacteriaceae bacterium]|nr:YfiR family protein [Acidobacteriaceae bacterium]